MRRKTLMLGKQVVSGTVLLLFVSVVLWVLWEEPSVSLPKDAAKKGLSVTVIEVVPGDNSIEISATGITKARWLTEVSASVNGRVNDVAANARPGQLLAKGDPLVALLDTFYQAEVDGAKARVAEAELELAGIKNRQYVAKKVDKAQTSFGRYEPHVKAAAANLKASQAALAAAQQQLADTQINSPFNAVVISETAHPGLWVSAGDVLFQIASSDFLDIKVEMPSVAWQRLNDIGSQNNTVRVITPNGQRWDASIRYLSPVMDATTRQRSMMLEVASPFKSDSPLLADQQVKIIFQGKTLANVVNAPASVLTEDGKVWSVIENTLRLESIELLDEQPETILFRYLNNPSLKRYLVRFPLSTLLDGQAVSSFNF